MRFKEFYLKEAKYDKDWLGMSKIPIQYHTTTNNFETIDVTKSDLGFHVGTYDQAKYRQNLLGGTGKILAYKINLRNPLKLIDVGSFHADNIADQLVKKGLISDKLAKEIVSAGWKERKKYNALVREILLKNGFDGVVYKNTHEGSGTSYIIIDPKNIKFVEEKSIEESEDQNVEYGLWSGWNILFKNGKTLPTTSGIKGTVGIKIVHDGDEIKVYHSDISVNDFRDGFNRSYPPNEKLQNVEIKIA